MSSRPNSSRNHQRSMYSSLPSASKIYVSTTKSKHKNIHSAKRKRKKSDQESSVVESINDETLVSLRSPIISSQIGLNGGNSPGNVKNKVNKRLTKEEWVENFVQFDESDSDSYTHDDKVKVVNTYFDVCIESDEFNDDQGTSNLETEESSQVSSDVKINDADSAAIDETVQTKNSELSVLKSDKELIFNDPITNGGNTHEKHCVNDEVSKSVVNNESDRQQPDCTVKNETHINDLPNTSSSQDLIIETIENNGEEISKGSSSLTPQNKSIDNVGASRVSITDDVLDINMSQIDPNISVTMGCKNNYSCDANVKKEKEHDLTSMAIGQENLHSGDGIHSLEEKIHDSYLPESYQAKNENEIVPAQGDIDTIKTMASQGNIDIVKRTSQDNIDAIKTMTSQGKIDTDEIVDPSYSLNSDKSTSTSNDGLEQDSCTESELLDINNLSDHSNELNLESNEQMDSPFWDTKIKIFPLKRSISLPESLQALKKIENFHANVASNITLLSDKATITVDSDNRLSLNEDQKFKDSDCNTVASGENVPMIDILPTLTMLKAKMR